MVVEIPIGVAGNTRAKGSFDREGDSLRESLTSLRMTFLIRSINEQGAGFDCDGE